jgi:hypothetical protein
LALCRPAGKDEPLAPPVALEAGFAVQDLRWRVGAKPGQVGTSALPERDQLFSDAVSELLPHFGKAEAEPAEYITGITEWVAARLEARAAAVEAGKYAFLFEPGQGMEEPPDVRALVLRRGDTKIAIVRVDAYVMHEQVHRRVAELVRDATGIDRDRLFIAGTHNHSVAHAWSPAPGIWTQADAFDPRHFVYVTRQIAAAVVDATSRLRPARLQVAESQFDDVQYNVIGPALTAFSPSEGAPAETVQAGYPFDHFDPQLVVMRFEEAKAPHAPVASVFTLGMHPESLNEGHGLLSGEWPRHVEKEVGRRTGEELMWLPAALGDSEPDEAEVDPTHDFWRNGFASMRVMNAIIADAVEDTHARAKSLEPDADPVLDSIARDVPGPSESPIPSSAYIEDIRLPMVRLIPDSSRMRLHIVRLGPVMLLGAPLEITTDVGYGIKTRVDQHAGNFYQGYVWPDAPAWVNERIQQNFNDDELDPALGAPIPIVVSVANGYFGYVVTRWEYDNRSHYREDMTPFGPGTADHIAASLVALAREMSGGAHFQPIEPPWLDTDLAGAERIARLLAGFDARVEELGASLPASEPARMGHAQKQPAASVATGSIVEFSWTGGTNDLPPPVVIVETRDGDAWREMLRGPSGELELRFAAPDTWTARFTASAAADELRFRVTGTYRGSDPSGSTTPFWDPDGRDRSYEGTSTSFRVE